MHHTLVTMLPILGFLACSQEDAYEDARARMVQTQLKARDISEPDVLAAMGRVERHRFVPGAARSFAYADRPLPIGTGQTISQPYIVALMTELAELSPDDVVLEIGTGSGYQAAVLAELVRHVYTIEIVPELAETARDRLDAEGYDNVTAKHGDGYLGWPRKGPFDAILVTAAPPSVPPALVDQLKPGAVMIIPVGPQGGIQSLRLIRKGTTPAETTDEEVIPVRFVPLVREER